MPFTNDEMDNIDASAGWKLCHRAAPHPAIDRQSLEAAIKRVRDHTNPLNGFWGNVLPLVCDAATKHLETLPKPEPKFRVVGVLRNSGKRDESIGSYPRAHALKLAGGWLETGGYNSVAVEQVSP